VILSIRYVPQAGLNCPRRMPKAWSGGALVLSLALEAEPPKRRCLVSTRCRLQNFLTGKDVL